jgi:hypothetical protein
MNKTLNILIISVIFMCIQSTAFAKKPVKSKLQKFETEPFQYEAFEASIRTYKGHDPIKLASGLSSRPEKDQYETTDQYQNRLAQWESKPLYGNVRINDMIAISGFFLSFERSYNADNQTITFNFKDDQVSVNDVTRPFMMINFDSKSLKDATGQTAMGVKSKYQRNVSVEFGVKFDNLIHSNEKYSIKAPPDEAKKSIIWSVLFIGKLSEPYYFSEENYHAPTLSEKYEQIATSRGLNFHVNEIVIYKTGNINEVLARIPFN